MTDLLIRRFEVRRGWFFAREFVDTWRLLPAIRVRYNPFVESEPEALHRKLNQIRTDKSTTEERSRDLWHIMLQLRPSDTLPSGGLVWSAIRKAVELARARVFWARRLFRRIIKTPRAQVTWISSRFSRYNGKEWVALPTAPGCPHKTAVFIEEVEVCSKCHSVIK